MKKKSLLIFLFFATHTLFANSSDSVTITFRAHKPSSPTMFVPGQFNNWGPNSNGNISPGAASQMTYNALLSAWLKTYTFKIHDPSRTPLGDSVYQYKMNQGGISSGWMSDPLNPETNPADNNNSVLRLSKLFWFQYYATETNNQISKITIGLVHANSDTIKSIECYSGINKESALTSTDITQFYNDTLRILDYTLLQPIPTLGYIKLIAKNNLGDSIVFEKGGYTIQQISLPTYAKHGVTLPSLESNDSTTFRLRVGERNLVLLRIAPVGQSLFSVTPVALRKNPTTNDWWLNMKLLPNTTYEYLYEFEDGKQITDPWGRYVGNFGTRFSTGADGLTADNFVWDASNYQRPPLNKAIIYELHVGEFAGGYYNKPSGTATFNDLKNLLPYFDSLGVNVLELMPINDYGIVGKSGNSWGYDLNSYFALEPAYGTPADFKSLVNEAHKKGIAIILDVVFNHQTEESPLWKMQPNETTNPYFKSYNDLRYNENALFFFKDIDHWTDETQELITNVLQMWVEEYKIDGFRYDFTTGIGWNVNEPTKGILGWTHKIDSLYNGEIYQIAEHLPESPALIYHSDLTGGWHDSFRDEIFDEARFRNTTLTEFENLVLGLGAYPGNNTPSTPSSYADRTEPVNFSINHDEQSLIYEMTTWQGVSVDDAVLRDKLYATFIFTSLGSPMLWQGQEFSAPRGWQNDNQKLSYRPLEWNFLSTERGKTHYHYYRSLIQQRRNNPALYNGTLQKLQKLDAQKTLVWGFDDQATSSQVVIIANLSNTQQTVKNVPWLNTGNWYDIFTQNILSVSTTPVDSIILPAYTAKVFSNKSNSELGIPTSVHHNNNNWFPTDFGLSQNYPNPFNPTTNIKFQIAKNEFVTLKVYDIIGREITTLVNEEVKAGNYYVTFDASKLSSGMYFYKIVAGNFIEVKKMVVMK